MEKKYSGTYGAGGDTGILKNALSLGEENILAWVTCLTRDGRDLSLPAS